VNGAGTKNYHRPAKTLTDRSLSRSQILRARDNYANTLPRFLAPTCEADDDKTQILTPTALKRDRERKREREREGKEKGGRIKVIRGLRLFRDENGEVLKKKSGSIVPRDIISRRA